MAGLIGRLREKAYLLKKVSPGLPVTSLYLTLDRARDQKKGYLMTFRQLRREAEERVGSLPRREALSLRADLERMEKWLRERRGFEEKACALFSSAEEGFWEEVTLPHPVPPLLVHDPLPYRLPLVEQASEEPGVVALLGRNLARFFLLAGGEMTELSSFCSDVPQNVKEGGWRSYEEKRIDHHILDHLHQHLRKAGETLLRFLRDTGSSWAVVGGSDEGRSHFQKVAPEEVLRAVIGYVDLPVEAEVRPVAEAAWTLYRGWREDQVEELLSRAEEKVARGEAAVGPEDVTLALERGAVEVLLLKSHLRLPGFSCACGSISPSRDGLPWRCLRCFSPEPGERREGAEYLLRRAEEQGSRIRFFSSEKLGASTGGLLALLRF